MGFFRILATTTSCFRCAKEFGNPLQFKTDGDDREMQEYVAGDCDAGLAPGEYEGIGEAFCPDCQLSHRRDENELQFTFLLESIRDGRIELWPARWNLDRKTGNLVVVRLRVEPVTPQEVEVAAQLPQSDRLNVRFDRWFFDHEVLCGGVRIQPRPDFPTNVFWNDERRVWVEHQLQSRGWTQGTARFTDVPIVVGDDHRIVAATDRMIFPAR
jgi:hypothetical protein